MKSIDFDNIEMVESREDLANRDLNKYCAIFIGGGNTYKLLNDIKERKEFIENNGIIFGGSAGAIIFGEDIDTCKFEDNNDIIGLKDTRGFNALNDISLLCHYGKKEDATFKNIEYLKEYSKNRKVLYLPEEDTIYIDESDIKIIGKEKYLVFMGGKELIDVSLNDLLK